ncbi:SDR family NAD(P)-dependent oxidoreductase [Sphingomonas colocasiae]|uniref:SDR family oxidoreductase n=1 Tax=Sphingomonas colocasiae TaxID=1848973 RepID=A0ABS7PSK8_9SPHN|nr:SDR family oxidoreductase [Sphingomonas colocasiae]MBY8824320.1 SDR family oxidoreductase [Sphingomonas colocasiae]
MGPFYFTGKTVLVVGGSSGIGNGIARAFLDCGAVVHVWGTRPNASDYHDSEGSDLTGLHYAQVDVANPDAVAARQPPFDKLDVLVHSQGTVVYRRGEFEREGWDKVMAVNLDSVMGISTKFRTLLAADGGGSIIVVSSISGFQANIGNPAYSASKAGAISLVRTLAKAWAGEGIRVNGIAPGLVDTKLTRVTTEHPERLDKVLTTIPRGRIGQPEDMGNAALFLASPLADYIAGQTIVVDGGLSLS